MKKLLYVALAIVSASFVTSCGLITKGGTNDTDSVAFDSLQIDSVEEDIEFTTYQVEINDSIPGSEGCLYYNATIAAPKGPKVLVDAVLKWLHDTYAHDYQGDISDVKAMFHSAAQNAFYDPDSESPGSTIEYTVELIANTDKYITYEVNGYDYFGGAHGMPYRYGQTFLKETGEELDLAEEIDTAGLAPILRKGVAEYLEVDDGSVDECLFDDAAKSFPMPGHAPWLTDKSVRFVYGAYEIAPYASGMPEADVLFKDIKSHLSAKVKALIEQ